MTPTALRRGTVVTVASAGAYSGKPRAAVVVQANAGCRRIAGCMPCSCRSCEASNGLRVSAT